MYTAVLAALLAAAPADELAKKANDALRERRAKEALDLAEQALKADPKNLTALYVRGMAHSMRRDFAAAVKDFDAALTLRELPDAYMARGVAQFKLGNVKEAVADMERYAGLKPEAKPELWQLGIAYYYAGRYADGAKLFELHRTVNPQDVENAAWHFLCKARATSIDEARKDLIPVNQDARVPMKEVQLLFAGKAKPADVLAAADANSPPEKELVRHRFYAHLYLGLYFEATGDAKQAAEHIAAAADKYRVTDYMWDVANVHRMLAKK
jgi:lipoprotein NlpI